MVPLFGDIMKFKEDIDAGNAFYHHLRKDGDKFKKYDMSMAFDRYTPRFCLISHEAHKAYDELTPTVLDRAEMPIYFKNLSEHTIAEMKTNKQLLIRRKKIMELLGFNSLSNYIPLMIKCLQDMMKKLKTQEKKEKVNLTSYFYIYVYEFMTELFFGKNSDKFPRIFEYLREDGQIEKIPVETSVSIIFDDAMKLQFSPVVMMIPNVLKLFTFGEVKRFNTNVDNWKKMVFNVAENLTDTECIAYKMMNTEGYPKINAIHDLFVFYFAGLDTSAHFISSCIFYIHKFPDVKKKIVDELETLGLYGKANVEGLYTQK
jgi:cytochrome P450